MAELSVYNLEGKSTRSVAVPEALTGDVNEHILWEVVKQYLANQRQGNACTKDRAEVSGGGKKPWKQKHTGRARHGSTRSPIWVKGGVTFGPKPREFRYSVNKKVRRQALLDSLKTKVGSEGLSLVEPLDGLEPKTRALAALLKQINVGKSALIVVEKPSFDLARIARNIPKVQVKPAADINCYDVLYSESVLMTEEALKQVEALS